jgi:hypothetical protein
VDLIADPVDERTVDVEDHRSNRSEVHRPISRAGREACAAATDMAGAAPHGSL